MTVQFPDHPGWLYSVSSTHSTSQYFQFKG